MLLNAAFWLAYAILVAFGWAGSYLAASAMKWVESSSPWAAPRPWRAAWYFLRRRSRPGYYFAGVLLAVIAVLSITDEFGLPDLISLLLSLVPLGLLLKDRKWYLQAGKE